jgi:hypothetical protein
VLAALEPCFPFKDPSNNVINQMREKNTVDGKPTLFWKRPNFKIHVSPAFGGIYPRTSLGERKLRPQFTNHAEAISRFYDYLQVKL